MSANRAKVGVAMIALAIAHELRQVQRQRSLRPEEAEEANRHARNAAAGLVDAGDVGDGERQLGLLRKAHRLCRRPPRFAQPRQPRVARLDPTHGLIEIEALRHAPQRFHEHQATIRIPVRAGHLATSPRLSE